MQNWSLQWCYHTGTQPVFVALQSGALSAVCLPHVLERRRQHQMRDRWLNDEQLNTTGLQLSLQRRAPPVFGHFDRYRSVGHPYFGWWKKANEFRSKKKHLLLSEVFWSGFGKCCWLTLNRWQRSVVHVDSTTKVICDKAKKKKKKDKTLLCWSIFSTPLLHLGFQSQIILCSKRKALFLDREKAFGHLGLN